MSGGGYGHDIRSAADGFSSRGPRRRGGGSEEPERKRIHTSRWENDPGRRDSRSPSGNGANGGSGGNGGNGGNGVSIRGRAANDFQTRRESSDAYSSRRSPPIHPHRLQTTMQHLVESGLTSASPSGAPPLSAQSNPPDFARKGSFSERSKGDDMRDNGLHGPGTSDRVSFMLESGRKKNNEDERRDNVFSPPDKGPRTSYSRRSSGADKEPAPDHSNDFVKAFAEYTESVVATSNLTFRRNLVKEKGDKRQSQGHRWHKHYRSFASLAEDQSRGTEKSASTLELSDSKIKQSQETQEKTVRRLVSSILANASLSSPRSIEDSSVNREISKIKAELKSVLDDTKQNIRNTLKLGTISNELERNFRDFAANSMTKSAMTDYESKLAHLTVNLQKLQTFFSQYENAFVQLPHVQDLIDKLNGTLLQFGQSKEKSDELSARIDQQNSRLDQQYSRLNMLKDEEQSRYEALGKNINDQIRELNHLKLEVTGDPEQEVKGLIEYITAGGIRTDNVEKNIQDFDNELESFTNRILKLESKMTEATASAKFDSGFEGFKERLESLETSMRLLQEKDSKSNANTVDVLGGKTDLTEASLKAHEQFSNLETRMEARMENIERDAVAKDEIVIGEVDRVEGLLRLHVEETKQLHEELSALRSQTAAPVVNQPLPPPSPINTSSRVEESLLQKIPALDNDFREFKGPMIHRTNTLEILVESLQQRFDNLSTEHMAAAIIHQMQMLYPPHPGNVQNELAQTKNRLVAIDQHMATVWGELPKFHARIEQMAQMTPILRSELLDTLERKLRDVATRNGPGDEGLHAMEGRFSHLVNDSHGKFLVAEQKFAKFTKESAESMDNLRRTFEGFKTSFDDQIVGVLRDMTALRADNTSYMTSINETLREMGVRLQSGQEDVMKELPSIHADIALLNQHTQINNPTVLAAIATAQRQEQEAEQEQKPRSITGIINPAPPEPQPAYKHPAALPPATKNPLSLPNNNNDIQQSPGALPSDRSPKNSSLATQALKRNRDSVDRDNHDDLDTSSSSDDARPMKVQRRRGSSNHLLQVQIDQGSRVATPQLATRQGASSGASER